MIESTLAFIRGILSFVVDTTLKVAMILLGSFLVLIAICVTFVAVIAKMFV